MFKNLLVPVDLAHESSWRKVLPLAIDQARHYDATLHVMTVIDLNLDITAVTLPEGFNDKYRQATEKRLTDLVKQHVPGDIQVKYLIREGRIYQEILKVADEIPADLIILASLRPSLKDYLLGANAARVVRHGVCSVLVIRE